MTARVQKPAPAFSATALVDGEFETLSLGDFAGRYLLLFFYPLDFTFVCPTEILAFSDRAPAFAEKGVSVVGCSIDSEFVHLAWSKTARDDGGISGLQIPLLADVGGRIASDYGVLLDDHVAARGLFLIDKEGIVRSITINDLPLGRSVDEAMRVVDALQFTEEHGEVCPANWTPGADTIVPDVTGSKAYFGKQGSA